MQDMNSPDNFSAEEKAFAASLSSLKPVRPEIQRDELLFAAGRASVRQRAVWPWQMATGISCALIVGLLFVHPFQAATQTAAPSVAALPPPVEASLPIAASFANPAPAASENFSYLQARQNVLAIGLAALPASTSGSAGNSPSPLDNADALPSWQQRAYIHQGAE